MPRSCSVFTCSQPAAARGLCQNHNIKQKKYGDALASLHHKAQLGRMAERLFAQECASAGRHVTASDNYNSFFDVTVDGWTIDVKASRRCQTYAAWNKGKTPSWQFRLHVHGKKDARLDFYLCRIEDPTTSDLPISLLIPAREVADRPNIVLSPKSLSRANVRSWMENYARLLAGHYGQKRVEEAA